MKLALALQLGRVSNLPTVWTNVLVGALLATGVAAPPLTGPVLAQLSVLLMLAMSLFYVGGMFLNDAFDRGFDARHRPERPIPSGQVTAREVFTWGFGLLGLGLLGVGLASAVAQGRPQPLALAAALGLGLAIVAYDAHHKANPLSPFVMGLCRVLVYLAAALTVTSTLPTSLGLAALALLGHLIGLTYIAKQEHLRRLGAWWPLLCLALPLGWGGWLALQADALALLLWLVYATVIGASLRRLLRRAPGDVPRAVVTLIAGICVLDALILATHGQTLAALGAMLAFVLTLALQRWVSGT